MKIVFPPDHIEDCGQWGNSRQYEALPKVFPVVTYLVMIWSVANHFIGYIQSNGDLEVFYQLQLKFGAMSVINPWGEPVWKFLTSCFIHSPQSFIHILFNMLMLFSLGPMMERGLGSLKFLVFIVITGFCSSALQASIGTVGVGFSGVVYAMVGFMWAAWPRWTGFLERFRGSTVKFLLFWQVICFLAPSMNVANTAHVSGMIIGGTIGLWACWGKRGGGKWLVASCLIVAISITVAFWSPWNPYYQRHQLIKEKNPTVESFIFQISH